MREDDDVKTMAAPTVDSAELAAAIRRDLVYLTQPISWRHQVLTTGPQHRFAHFCRSALDELEYTDSSVRVPLIRDQWLTIRARFAPSWAVRLRPWNWMKVYAPPVPKRLAPQSSRVRS